MAETLFPQRQRCKSCGKGLGKQGQPVYLGLYCTLKCGSLVEPVQDPEMAPRECKTQRDGRWEFKRRYRSEHEIPQRLRDDPSVNWYWCNGSCHHIHIGHSRIDLATEQYRMLSNPADLADYLIKARGKATRKQVAEVAGIRPIRLKELEEPGTAERIDLEALFKVIALYQARIGVALKAGR